MIAVDRRTPLGIALGAALLSSLAGLSAQAQQFPSKPLHFVHGSAAGSASDTIFRPVMEKLSATLGQPVLTEPRPGGGGLVSALYVRSQPPDGYTFYMAANTLITRSVEPNARDYDGMSKLVKETGLKLE